MSPRNFLQFVIPFHIIIIFLFSSTERKEIEPPNACLKMCTNDVCSWRHSKTAFFAPYGSAILQGTYLFLHIVTTQFQTAHKDWMARNSSVLNDT